MSSGKFTLIFCSLFGLTFGGLWGQGTISMRNNIPVVFNGDTLDNPWAGGLNNPQFSTIDLNLDGKKDLFIFDRGENSILLFTNEGSASQPDYKFAPQYLGLFPDSLADWVLLRDYDGDGFEDIWTGTSSSYIRVYHNDAPTNGGQHIFSLKYNPLKTHYPSLLSFYSARADVPAIFDYDGDGDLDFVTFEILGAQIEWHKNVAVDSGWGLDTLSFWMQSSCFGHMQESGFCTANLHSTPFCPNGMRTSENEVAAFKERHTGSTILPVDFGADNIFDFIIGDASCDNLYAVYNGGTITIADFDSVETNFPSQNTPVSMQTYLASYYADVDGDGKRDLLVSPNTPQFSADRRGVMLYHNSGQDNDPAFQYVQTDWLQGGMIDIGSGSASAFFDYDNDGLADILLSNDRYHVSDSVYRCALYLLRNTGTAATPAYELIDTNYLGLATLPAFANVTDLVPAFGDLDGDSDKDLLIGTVDGTIYYFKNNGGSGTANFGAPIANFENIDVGFSAAPFLYDLNGDSDLDLLVGTFKGRIYYYENTGNVSSYQFDSVSATFGNIKINDFGGNPLSLGYAKPIIADYDNNGQDEFMIGTVEGEIQIYTGITLTPGATFPYAGNFFNDHDFGSYSSISASVTDTSGSLSFLIGSTLGGLRWIGEDPAPVSLMEPTRNEMLVSVFPNPSQGAFTIELPGISPPEGSRVRLYSPEGRELLNEFFYGKFITLNATRLNDGIYFLRVENKNGMNNSRIVILNP